MTIDNFQDESSVTFFILLIIPIFRVGHIVKY